MKVSELIKKLQELEPSMNVMINDVDYGLEAVVNVIKVNTGYDNPEYEVVYRIVSW